MRYAARCLRGRSEVNDFFQLPYRVYEHDPLWVAPVLKEQRRLLDTKRNPYFHHASLALFGCYDEHQLMVARCSVVIHPGYAETMGLSTALFGFFEAMNNREAVTALFAAVTTYCAERAVQQILGPFNPNHYSEMGLQISGFDTLPVFFQSYNPSYYLDVLQAAGFSVSTKIHTRRQENTRALNTSYADHPFSVPSGYSFRCFDIQRRGEELESLRDIYNDAFSENVFFLPLSKEEYQFSAKYLSLVTDPDMIIFAEYEGEAIGVVQYAYDINPALQRVHGKPGFLSYVRFMLQRKKTDTAVVFAVATKKAFRNSRSLQMLVVGSLPLIKRFRVLETTWMSYENPVSVRSASRRGFQPDKEFVIMKKRIQ